MKKIFIALASLGTMISIADTPALVGATTIDMPTSAPNSGYVVLDDNDHVIDASSLVIKDLAQKSENSTNSIQPRDVVNWRHSRWVYYTDHNNYGYKWSHSNYYHSQTYHTSAAAVGGANFTRRGANAHSYSMATAAGRGRAQAWYWAPYV